MTAMKTENLKLFTPLGVEPSAHSLASKCWVHIKHGLYCLKYIFLFLKEFEWYPKTRQFAKFALKFEDLNIFMDFEHDSVETRHKQFRFSYFE